MVPNLNEVAHYYQLAANFGNSEAIAIYFNFIKGRLNQAGIFQSFVEFAEKQVGDLRTECEYLIATLEFSDAVWLGQQKFSISKLIQAKNLKESWETRFNCLEQFFEAENPWQLKLSAYAVCETLLLGSHGASKQGSMKKLMETHFKAGEAMPIFYSGLQSDLCREESLRILTRLETDLSRLVLLDYYSPNYRNKSTKELQTILAEKSHSVTPCEILAINKCLALSLYKDDRNARVLKSPALVKKQLEISSDDPEAKEVLAQLLKDNYFGSGVSSAETAKAAVYFYEVACQFLDLYLYAKSEDDALFSHALGNLSEAAQLGNESARVKFEELRLNGELKFSAKEWLTRSEKEFSRPAAVPASKGRIVEEDFYAFSETAADTIHRFIGLACGCENDNTCRDFLNEAAERDPICYAQIVLGYFKANRTNESTLIMMLDSAQKYLMNAAFGSKEVICGENPQKYLVEVSEKLALLRAPPFGPVYQQAHHPNSTLFPAVSPVNYSKSGEPSGERQLTK